MLDCINCVISSIGYFILSYGLYRLGLIIYELFIIKERNFLEIYGKESWALVTGSTDGMGLCYAKALLRRGYKVILASRNPKKLADRKFELE